MWLQFRANFAGGYIEMRMRLVHLSMHTEGIKAFLKRIRRCSVDGRKWYEVWTKIFLKTEQKISVFVWKRISVDEALGKMCYSTVPQLWRFRNKCTFYNGTERSDAIIRFIIQDVKARINIDFFSVFLLTPLRTPGNPLCGQLFPICRLSNFFG